MALFGVNYQPRLFSSRRQSFVVVSDGTRISGAVVFDDNSGAGDSFPDYIVQDPITQDLDNNNFAGAWEFISDGFVPWLDQFTGYTVEDPVTQTLNDNTFNQTGSSWSFIS